MDGSAIMQGVATVFIATVYAVHLGMADYITVIVTATLASIGTAGVPGVGLFMLAMVFKQVGLPVEGIALIIGVDRLLDMVRTAVNVTGDTALACIVAASEARTRWIGWCSRTMWPTIRAAANDPLRTFSTARPATAAPR